MDGSPSPTPRAFPSLVQAAISAARQFAREPYAAACNPGEFPSAAVARLHALGLLAAPLPASSGGVGLGIEAGGSLALLRVLAAVGRHDLSVGRLYEGHCNALQLIFLYGTVLQRGAAAADARAGRLFAVWNTEEPSEPVRLEQAAANRLLLRGAKTFCSGAGHVQRPLITARTPSGQVQMCLVRADAVSLPVDMAGWRPLGMAASTSGRVVFDGVHLETADLVGEPGDYPREPWFLGGAARFAAVQLGGAEALLRVACDHLRDRGRSEDASQIARIGTMAVAVDGGRARLERCAGAIDRCLASGTPSPDARLAERAIEQAQITRLAVERICLDVLELATRSVGVAGLLQPHPLERWVRDLTTYLRQPAPDAALASIGRALLDDPAAFVENDHDA